MLFSILDNRIWFRNYQVSHTSGLIHLSPTALSESVKRADMQIIEKDPLQPAGPPQVSLTEIGPRFVLTPIRIFEGSFGGPTVFENSEFISPASVRASAKRAAGEKYRQRRGEEDEREERGKRLREEVGEDELSRKKVFA
jgi:ribosome biogenesis protein BRX1